MKKFFLSWLFQKEQVKRYQNGGKESRVYGKPLGTVQEQAEKQGGATGVPMKDQQWKKQLPVDHNHGNEMQGYKHKIDLKQSVKVVSSPQRIR